MLRRGLSVLLMAIAIMAAVQNWCYAGNASITSSGETLYFLDTVPPIESVAPSSLDFGQVATGNSATLSVTVTNNGAGQLTIGALTSPSAPFSTITDTCSGQSVAQNGTCTVTIRFAPTVNGTFNSSFSIPSNDIVMPNFGVPLTGRSSGPIMSVTPNPAAFGTVSVGSTGSVALTVQNTGNSSLTIGSYGNPSAPFSNFGGCTAGTVLTPTQTCTLTLHFSPTSSGNFNGLLTINSDALNTPIGVTLTGTGALIPQIGIAPNPCELR